jgi:phosphoribosylglycinamide formyltransferase-1
VLDQAEVPVEAGDTPETLAARVQERERRLVVDVLGRIALGELVLDGLPPRGK